jgi:hypothetical protein
MYIDITHEGCMPTFIGIRGSSKLEGYHRYLNALLSGGHYLAKLAGALIALFNYRWNYDSCPIQNMGATVWGMYDYWLLKEMQETCASMGWDNPCPAWRPAPPTTEHFGVDCASSEMLANVARGEEVEEELGSIENEADNLKAFFEEQRMKSLHGAGKTDVCAFASSKVLALNSHWYAVKVLHPICGRCCVVISFAPNRSKGILLTPIVSF